MAFIVGIVQELYQTVIESPKFFSIEFKIHRLENSMMLLKSIFRLISTSRTTISPIIKVKKLSVVSLSFKGPSQSLKMSLNHFSIELGDPL
jgi:hypothetical protein